MQRQADPRMMNYLAFSEAQKNLQPPLDINEYLKYQMGLQGVQEQQETIRQTQQSAPPEALMMLAGQFGNRPDMMKQAYPWWPQDQQLPQAEELMQILGEGKQPKERRPVVNDQGQPAEALVGPEGEILGFVKPGTQTPLERFNPSSESVGGYQAFMHWLKNFLGGAFDFTKPKFNQPGIPIQKGQ